MCQSLTKNKYLKTVNEWCIIRTTNITHIFLKIGDLQTGLGDVALRQRLSPHIMSKDIKLVVACMQIMRPVEKSGSNKNFYFFAQLIELLQM